MAEMTAHERIDAAIRCEQPDRVPIIPMMDFFCARYKGVPLDEFIADNDLGRELLIEVFDEFDGWDATFQSTTLNEFAFALTLPIPLKIPGRELPGDAVWQFDEIPVMSLEDYDFAIEHGWQALWGKVFPAVRPLTPPNKIPELLESWVGQAIKDTIIWKERGVLSFTGVAIVPPFEFFSMGRSLKEFTLDLYRHPDKVVAAMDAITPGLIEATVEGQLGIRQATGWGYRTCFIGSTRASGTFISPRMFERFAWPYIKQIALALIDAGVTPLFHFDSNWTPMLSYFKELPKGSCVLELDSATDIFKAKEVLKGHMCLMGDVPAALLKLGTQDEVAGYVKKLVEVVGEDGGFILSTGCDTPVDARPENVRAMIDAGKSYGIYN
ncbi:MAG TPA: uroporphyrinogen-III decarboxylase [Chloroflexi bacterium]|nr:uroporphyrinogen-III decarboxylase [Chloroflexota bacterium]